MYEVSPWSNNVRTLELCCRKYRPFDKGAGLFESLYAQMCSPSTYSLQLWTDLSFRCQKLARNVNYVKYEACLKS